MSKRSQIPLAQRWLVLLAVAGGAWSIGETADAYPQWQLSTGATRCNQCHFAPAGGGLINNYGRDAVGEDLSTFGGDGAFLHGAVKEPAWLALGADLRGALVANQVQDPGGAQVAVFPMQADLEARVALPAGFSIEAVGGLRGQVRNPGEVVPLQNYQPVSTSQLVSREHYLLWEPEAIGPYLRVGRFFAPFGLRMAEHILYINRDLGFDELEETYNVSGGVIYPNAELHLTLFAPDFVRHIGSDEKGFAAYMETRFHDDTVVLGVQSRLAVDPFTDIGDPVRTQIVGAAGFSVFPVRGVMATLLGERNQIDVALPDSWTASTLVVSWFPYAHFEAQLMGRLQFPSGGDAAKTLFLQIHYFL
jgi:hypothetical protein